MTWDWQHHGIKDVQGEDTRRAPEFEIDSNIKVWFIWTAVIKHLRMKKIELPKNFCPPRGANCLPLSAATHRSSEKSFFHFFVLDKFTTTVTQPGILRSLASTPHQRWDQVPSSWSWTRRGSRFQTSESSFVRQKGTMWCRSCTWTWRYLVMRSVPFDIWQHLHQQSGIDGIVTINYKELIC